LGQWKRIERELKDGCEEISSIRDTKMQREQPQTSTGTRVVGVSRRSGKVKVPAPEGADALVQLQ
jgi:hypothetical protein